MKPMQHRQGPLTRHQIEVMKADARLKAEEEHDWWLRVEAQRQEEEQEDQVLIHDEQPSKDMNWKPATKIEAAIMNAYDKHYAETQEKLGFISLPASKQTNDIQDSELEDCFMRDFDSELIHAATA